MIGEHNFAEKPEIFYNLIDYPKLALCATHKFYQSIHS